MISKRLNSLVDLSMLKLNPVQNFVLTFNHIFISQFNSTKTWRRFRPISVSFYGYSLVPLLSCWRSESGYIDQIIEDDWRGKVRKGSDNNELVWFWIEYFGIAKKGQGFGEDGHLVVDIRRGVWIYRVPGAGCRLMEDADWMCPARGATWTDPRLAAT